MTISNRDAATDGTLGDDVLTMAEHAKPGRVRRDDDTQQEWIDLYKTMSTTEPGCDRVAEVTVLLTDQACAADNGIWIVRKDGSHERPSNVKGLAVGDDALTIQTPEDADRLFGKYSDTALLARYFLARYGKATVVADGEVVATVNPSPKRAAYCTAEDLATTVNPLDFATREDIDATLAEASAKVDHAVVAATLRDSVHPFLFKRDSLRDSAHPLYVVTGPPFAGPDEERDALRVAIDDTGVMLLPPGATFEIVEPTWPNPSSMDPGQVWAFNDFGLCDGTYVVNNLYPIDCAALRADIGDDAGCCCSTAIGDPKRARCVGYELPDGSRIMVGEWRELAPGRDPWRVDAVESDGLLALSSRRGERRYYEPKDLAAYPLVDAPLPRHEVNYSFTATGDDSVATAFKSMIDACDRAKSRLATVPTMRAECSTADVIEGEQSRRGSPPSADCGPAYARSASPTIQAMIDAGYTVDRSLL